MIAKEFSRTRRFVWQDLNPLADFTATGDRVLDIGCGNGRLLQIFQDIDYTGIDASGELITEAKKNYPNDKFYVYDALRMPLPTNHFDKAYAIAVLHHIPSRELRLQFLKEAKRVLRQNGLLILTVWNLWNWQGLGLILKYLFLKILGRSKLDFQDVFVPWAGACQRYIHVFSKGELKQLAEGAGFKVKEIGILGTDKKKNKNLYLIAENI